MAVEVSGLPAAGALTGSELIVVVQGGQTRQTTAGVLAAGGSVGKAGPETMAGPLTVTGAITSGGILSGTTLTLPDDGGIAWGNFTTYMSGNAVGGTLTFITQNVQRAYVNSGGFGVYGNIGLASSTLPQISMTKNGVGNWRLGGDGGSGNGFRLAWSGSPYIAVGTDGAVTMPGTLGVDGGATFSGASPVALTNAALLPSMQFTRPGIVNWLLGGNGADNYFHLTFNSTTVLDLDTSGNLKFHGRYIHIENAGEAALVLTANGVDALLSHGGWGLPNGYMGLGGASAPDILVDTVHHRVGIGTATPQNPLAIYLPTGGSGFEFTPTASGVSASMVAFDRTTAAYAPMTIDYGASLTFRRNGSSNTFSLDASGNLAILGNFSANNIGPAASYSVGTSAGFLPVLDGSGKLLASVLPSIAVNNTFVVASQAAMLATGANVGDVAVRTDTSETWILKTAGAATLANWVKFLTATSALTSVAGRTGAVTLSNTDISGLGTFATLSSLTSANIISYLGYTPMNPASYNAVENKSSATIRGELTAANVNTALGKVAARMNAGSGANTGLISVGTAAPSGTPDDGQIYLQYS